MPALPALNCVFGAFDSLPPGHAMAESARKTLAAQSVEERIAALDWEAAGNSLCDRGYAVTPPIFSPEECISLVAMYAEASRFRSQIMMQRYRFGVGDYKYFGNPLPEIVSSLRTSAYPHLAKVANQWADLLGDESPRFPAEHESFLRICHKGGQVKAHAVAAPRTNLKSQ